MTKLILASLICLFAVSAFAEETCDRQCYGFGHNRTCVCREAFSR